MIVAVVRFALPATMTADDVRASFEASAPNYQHVAGLMRKHYLHSSDGAFGGGVYLWESREAAEALYTDEWRDRLTQRFGAAPQIEWFDSPVTVDAHQIVVDHIDQP